jgi:regulator of sigma D
MKISLIKGTFESAELLEIISQMIHVKIKYHENQIKYHDSEENIKMREKRIIELQKDLYEVRNAFLHADKIVHADAEIELVLSHKKQLVKA